MGSSDGRVVIVTGAFRKRLGNVTAEPLGEAWREICGFSFFTTLSSTIIFTTPTT